MWFNFRNDIKQGSPNYGPRANTGPRAPPIRPAVAGRTYPVSGPHCKIYCQKRKKSHQPIYATDQSLSDDDFKYFFCSTLSEFENFLLCERILVNLTTCQNKTSSKFYRFSAIWSLWGSSSNKKKSCIQLVLV
jgi:hypothetical protein